MLNHPPLLSNQQLLYEFFKESKRFMEGLDKNLPYNDMQAIGASLKKFRENWSAGETMAR